MTSKGTKRKPQRLRGDRVSTSSTEKAISSSSSNGAEGHAGRGEDTLKQKDVKWMDSTARSGLFTLLFAGKLPIFALRGARKNPEPTVTLTEKSLSSEARR